MCFHSAEQPVVKEGDGGVISLVHVQVMGIVPDRDPVQRLPGEAVQIDAAVVDLVELGVDHIGNHDGDKIERFT